MAFLLECLASGMSVAEIVDAYPTLAEDAVRGVLQELARKQEAVAVRILLDENMPRKLRDALVAEGHEVHSVRSLRLDGIDNGR